MTKPMSDERLKVLRRNVHDSRLLPWVTRDFGECLDEIDRLRAQAKADEEAMRAVCRRNVVCIHDSSGREMYPEFIGVVCEDIDAIRNRLAAREKP